MSGKPYYFRCKTNPTGPLLVLHTYWEAAELKNHPDYERIDETGEVIVDEESQAEGQIPLQFAGGRKA